MGTRNLTAVIKDGTRKIAQYGQWDGYPEGQGETILTFLQEPGNLEGLRTNVDLLHFTTDEENAAVLREQGCADLVDKEWVNMEEAARWDAALPSLSRNLGAGILNMVAYNGPEFGYRVKDDWEFGEDSLFCEWAYVLDLDTDTLEIYQGFQKEVHDQGRWADAEPQREYFPIKLIKTFTFAELVGKSVEDFAKEIYAETNQEE